MALKRKQIPGPEERLTAGTDKQIRERLTEFVRIKFGNNWSRFAQLTEIPLATLEGWKTTGKQVPQMKHLRRLGQHGLSLDWLVNGWGEMTVESVPARSDMTALLHLMRPVLQRLTNAGDLTAMQAFDRLVLVDLGPEGMLELAATGLLPRFTEIVRDLKRWDDRTQMHDWVLQRMDVLAEEARAGDAQAVSAVLNEISTQLSEYVPEYVRLGAIGRERVERAQENAQAQIREAERHGFSPAAFTTAAEVSAAVRSAMQTLKEIAQAVARPRPDLEVRQLLKQIGSMLTQLESGVRSLQTSQETGNSLRAQVRDKRRK